jgi:Anti-sigma-K factor rskA
MTCDQFQDMYELYALGALETTEATALRDHLAGGCNFCTKEIERAIELNEIISRDVPLVNPPSRLRRRIIESFAPRRVRRWQWVPWLVPVAALLVMTVGLMLQNRARRAELARVSNVLEILQAPGTKQVAFAGEKPDSPHGSLYIHQKLGIALVVGSLPAAPAGWKYESWVVPKTGNPEPVEPFQADAQGRAVSVVRGPVDLDTLAAVAVSMEPKDSQPTKPTTVVFAAHV